MTTITPQQVKLSPKQSEIVHYKNGEGALLVVAAAGSGKTRILTERVRYLLTQKQGRFSVLCLTFTNKAAEEMQDRLSNPLIPDLNRRSFIGTLHGFALQILIARRNSIGFDEVPHILERENDKKKILEQVFIENPILQEYYLREDEKTQRTLIDQYMNWISEQKRNLVIIDNDTSQYNGWSEQRLVLYKSYNQLLREQNMVDYDDILLLTYRILAENEAILRLYQRTYPYILVDEAQDLSYAQYHLIKVLVGDSNKNIFMVGDPNQAIHAYAGADKKFMLENFIEDFHADKETIDKNFRSSKAVISLANKILPSRSNPDDSYYDGEIEVKGFQDEKEEASWIFNKIKSMIEGTDETVILRGEKEIEGKLTLDKIAVIARNRFVFSKLENLLKEDELFAKNYLVKKTTEILDVESDLMKIFDLGTRIISNPSNQLHFQQICNLLKIAPPQYKNISGIEKLSKLQSLLSQNDEKMEYDFNTLLESWNILSTNQSKMYDALTIIENYAINLDANERELVISDINEEYRNAWKKFLGNTTPNNINLSAFRQVLAMGVTNANKQKGLTLATVHTVKGLGFDVVFLMGMTEGTFPDYRAKTEKLLEEERNTAYVAITRAKRWLYITYPKMKMMPWGDSKNQTISRFISDFQ
jgi:DNA helicase II / ATP-dependent DNA helicase PcrA